MHLGLIIIVGAEHDAVELCKCASSTGWGVDIIAPPDDPKSIENFPDASQYLSVNAQGLKFREFDVQTAIILMIHSYVKDLTYLSAVGDKDIPYVGLLGPSKRREKLIREMLEINGDVPDTIFDRLYGPAGLNLGAVTSQEIAISIIAEILTVIRKQKPISLRGKSTRIHQ